MSRSAPITDPVAQAAAQWVVLLGVDDPVERRRAIAGFDAWKRADPRHAQVAEQIQRFLARVESVRQVGDGSARSALRAADAGRRASGRRTLLRGAAVGGMAALLLAAFTERHRLRASMADLSTGTGQWLQRSLSDGSRLVLDTGSAVDLRFDDRTRRVELLAGEILVDVARDASRSFEVVTRHARVVALGTRFVVRDAGDGTEVSMLESRARVERPGQAGGRVIEAGQRVSVGTDGIGPIGLIDVRMIDDTWRHRRLVVQGRPLDEVLDEIARRRGGLMRIDRPALRRLQVSAVLPLDDPDQALALLAATFPRLRVRRLTPLLTLVDLEPG